MKLTVYFLSSLTLVAMFTVTSSARVVADRLAPDPVYTVNEEVYFSADHPGVDDEMIAYVVSGNSQQGDADLIQKGENHSDPASSFTSSHSDALELVKSGANATDYTLSAEYAQNHAGDTRLANYVDNPEAQKIALQTDVLRGGSNVPEPSSIILFTLGLLGLCLMRRQKKCAS